MSRFAITGTSQLRFRTTDANQKGVFPNASRTLSDARRERFLHSARYARFGRNDKNRPSISPSIRVSQAIKMIPPHCRFEHGRGPLPRHFEHGTKPAPLSFRARDEARPLVISSTGRRPPPCHFEHGTKAAPLSFRPEARSAGVEKSHAPSAHETSPLRCLTAPPVEMTRRDKKACHAKRLQA